MAVLSSIVISINANVQISNYSGGANLIWTHAKLPRTGDLEFFDTCEFVVSELFRHFLRCRSKDGASVLFFRIRDTLNSCGSLWVSSSMQSYVFVFACHHGDVTSVTQSIAVTPTHAMYHTCDTGRLSRMYIIIDCHVTRDIFPKCEWTEGVPLLTRLARWPYPPRDLSNARLIWFGQHSMD